MTARSRSWNEPGENFGSRSRGAVDEYSQRYFEVEWLSYSFIDALVARVSASGAQNFGAFGHEVRGNLYALSGGHRRSSEGLLQYP